MSTNVAAAICTKPTNVFLDRFNYVNKMVSDLEKSSPFDFKKIAAKMGQKDGNKDEGKNEESNIIQLVNMQKNGKKDEKEGMMVDMTKNKDAKMLPLSKIFPTKWRTIAPIIEADEGEGRRLGGHEGGKGKGKKKP